MVDATQNPARSSERRQDPRTSRSSSLINLLRTRAERLAWDVAVVGTRDGFLLGSSRGAHDRFAQKAAAHVSAHLFAGRGESDGSFTFTPPKRPDVKLRGARIVVRGQQVFVAVIALEPDEAAVGEVASAVERILNEPARARATSEAA